MAGRARYQALKAELDQRTGEAFLLDADPASKNHLDYVCEWIEGGHTQKQLAQDLTDTLGFEVQATRLKAYLVELFGTETVEQRLDDARKHGAVGYAESALAIVDEDAETTVAVSRNASRARTRQWLAERYNPQRFGQAKGLSVTINTGELHLAALQAPTQVAARARLIEPPGGMHTVAIGDTNAPVFTADPERITGQSLSPSTESVGAA